MNKLSIKSITLISLALLVGCATLERRTATEGRPATRPQYNDFMDQIAIDLPRGWIAYDQREANRVRLGKEGKPSRFGVVYFSEAKNIAELHLVGKARAEMDTGKLPSFFVERVPAIRNTACKRFPEKAIQQVLKVKRRSFGKSRIVKELQTRAISIGGCKGFRIRGEVQTPRGENWVHDVHVVSDGTVMYLFTLRNIKENYEKRLDAYENAIATVRLTAALQMSASP